MPQIIIKGMDVDKVKAISTSLVDELQRIMDCPRDYFQLEVSTSVFIMDGKQVEITPLVQVKWFDRGQRVQDQAAAAICRHGREAGYDQVETFFIPLEKERYYDNENHY